MDREVYDMPWWGYGLLLAGVKVLRIVVISS